MKFHTLFSALFFLSGCTKSCAKTESTPEHWPLQVQTLTAGTSHFVQTEAIDLVLSDKRISLIQSQNKVELEVVSWDKPDFAKVTLGKEIGYFKWDVVPGQRRSENRPYKCGEAADAPIGVTQVDETEQTKTVIVHLENAETQAVTLLIEATVPTQSFWAQTGSSPITLCPRQATPPTTQK